MGIISNVAKYIHNRLFKEIDLPDVTVMNVLEREAYSMYVV